MVIRRFLGFVERWETRQQSIAISTERFAAHAERIAKSLEQLDRRDQREKLVFEANQGLVRQVQDMGERLATLRLAPVEGHAVVGGDGVRDHSPREPELSEPLRMVLDEIEHLQTRVMAEERMVALKAEGLSDDEVAKDIIKGEW